MRIVIAGVGDIGLRVAKTLAGREDSELILVDADEDRCEELSKKLDALVICGDATDPEILRKAQTGQANALVATTGLDPINTVIAMLGRQLEVPTVIVKLNGAGLRPACEEIGVQKVIAPKIAAAGHIESAVHGLDRIDFSMIARGGLQLVEYMVRELEIDSLADLKVPDGAHIAAVSHGDDVLIPRQGMNLAEDDGLLILLESDEARKAMDEKVKKHEKKQEQKQQKQQSEKKQKEEEAKTDKDK